jgi:hypothetical protein
MNTGMLTAFVGISFCYLRIPGVRSVLQLFIDHSVTR